MEIYYLHSSNPMTILRNTSLVDFLAQCKPITCPLLKTRSGYVWFFQIVYTWLSLWNEAAILITRETKNKFVASFFNFFIKNSPNTDAKDHISYFKSYKVKLLIGTKMVHL